MYTPTLSERILLLERKLVNWQRFLMVSFVFANITTIVGVSLFAITQVSPSTAQYLSRNIVQYEVPFLGGASCSNK